MNKYNPNCWLAAHGVYERPGGMPPCEGRLVKMHLIKRQVIKRYVGEEFVWDDPVWVWACGGFGYGCSGHHGALDHARSIRIPWEAIPASTLRWAKAHRIDWWLSREYR